MTTDAEKKAPPRVAGVPLRALSIAAGLPVLDRVLATVLAGQMDLGALEAVEFGPDEVPWTLPRPPAAPLATAVGAGDGSGSAGTRARGRRGASRGRSTAARGGRR